MVSYPRTSKNSRRFLVFDCFWRTILYHILALPPFKALKIFYVGWHCLKASSLSHLRVECREDIKAVHTFFFSNGSACKIASWLWDHVEQRRHQEIDYVSDFLWEHIASRCVYPGELDRMSWEPNSWPLDPGSFLPSILLRHFIGVCFATQHMLLGAFVVK